jgi:RimJ/RimL family protein N-acetyltransferase/4'-phosphopantetheinyl transferase EntD
MYCVTSLIVSCQLSPAKVHNKSGAQKFVIKMSTTIVFSALNEEVQVNWHPTPDHGQCSDLWCMEDQEKWQRIRSEARRNEMAASRSALQDILGQDLQQMHFKGDKPQHPSGPISLSHCKTGAVAAHSSSLAIGVDVEVVRSQLTKIASKFVREDEQYLMEDLVAQDALQLIWGIKESLFKLCGAGGVDFREHLHITTLEKNSDDSGWIGMAWIYPRNGREVAKACLIQGVFHEGTYICLATHRRPMAPIETERFTLREWNLSDAPWLYELNQDPKVVHFTGDAGFDSIVAAQRLIATYLNYQRDGYGRWVVEDRNSGEVLGWCGLKKNPWGIDLGYRFFRKFWGQGVATECAEATVKWARGMGLPRIIGRTLTGNPASKRVLEKLNFESYSEQPIEDFAAGQRMHAEDLKRWEGQQMVIMKLDL